ncbi:unnamed protein product [Durusdinium trenchii]|uniref:Uncharacterized protein n=1 Tax=Durusdinium trenchii TaxID=1381693 RepID=A0ABP0KV52_9DINO
MLLREWLSSCDLKTKNLLPGEVLVRKFLPPGIVADLFEHYQATQSLLGGYAVSCFSHVSQLWVGGWLCCWIWGTPKKTRLQIQVWNFLRYLQATMERHSPLQIPQSIHNLRGML